MKKIYFVILMICIFTSCKKEDSSENEFVIPTQLLMNTDLESSPSGDFFYWWNFGLGTGFYASWTDEESFSPSHSLKIARTTVDSTHIYFWSQNILNRYYIPFGHDLTLTVKIKGINLEGAGVSIVIFCEVTEQDFQFESTQGTISITGTFDWTTYTLELLDVKSNTNGIFVYLIYLENTTGTVYFDDITLTHK